MLYQVRKTLGDIHQVEASVSIRQIEEEIAAHQALVRQAKDGPIVLSIQAAQVDYFVTYDRDFTDSRPTTAKVRQAIPGILLPPVFLREVMGWTSEQLEAIRHRNWSDLEELN